MSDPDVDKFSSRLLEESKRFLELAKPAAGDARGAYLHASLLLAFCALEAHVNAVSADFVGMKGLDIMERAILEEKEVRLKKGKLTLDGFKMFRLSDRIEFLITRFGGMPVNTADAWWQGIQGAIDTRNKIVHPKSVSEVKFEQVERAVEAVIATIDQIYLAAYKTGFPAAKRGLQSKMTF
ncbi:MAG: hypothetical protein Q8M32_14810 [Brevundimonas sp.]|nr:hypothetical protein [Brevundimonas sp.]